MRLLLIILLGLLVNCNSLIILKNTTFEICQQVDENTLITNSANDTINTYLFIALFQDTIGCNNVKKCELYVADYYNHKTNVCYKLQNYHLDRNVEVEYDMYLHEPVGMLYFAIFLLVFMLIIVCCYSRNHYDSKCCHCDCNYSCHCIKNGCNKLISCCNYSCCCIKNGCNKCYSNCYGIYYRIKRKKC